MVPKLTTFIFAEQAEEPASAKRPKCTPEETAEGTALMAEILQAWQERADEVLPELSESAAVPSAVSDAAESRDEIRAEKELALLKSCLEEYRPRLEKNAWATSILLDTY